MKSAILLPLAAAAAASAFIIPDEQVLAELSIHSVQRQELPKKQPQADASWKDWLPATDSLTESVSDFFNTVATDIDDVFEDVKSVFGDDVDGQDFGDDAIGKPGHHKHGKNQTIYQLINKSKYTTKFAELVNEYDDIVQLLNSTKANYTLFVPVDSAFEHIPEDKKPSKEFVEAVLKYHIGLGLYPAGRVLFTHTLPTALDEPLLGDKPQRLRTSVGLFSGVRVNFYSKVIAVDIPAKNGVIHAVKSLLVPPPPAGRVVSLFPSKFSTLLLAYDKTNFADFLDGVKLTGSTVFAPDNTAFAKLGPAANAFLFNTEKGLGYLKALLKYHIVPDEVVYSDAYYSSGDEKGEGEREGEGVEERDDVGRGHYHLDVPTLLDEKNLAIDVSRFAGYINVKLNGYITLKVQDAVAKDGVIHLPNSVLIPPHKGHGEEAESVDGEISVEELMARLDGFVEKPATGEKGEIEL